MPALTIDGTAVEVQDQQAAARPAERPRTSASFGGQSHSSETDGKRSWTFRTPPLTESEMNGVLNTLDPGGESTISGDVLDGASVTGVVLIQNISYSQHYPAPGTVELLYTITFEIRET